MTVEELIDRAIGLFGDALSEGNEELANAAAGIALDLACQVRYAEALLETGKEPADW